jgi:hypothetical protein
MKGPLAMTQYWLIEHLKSRRGALGDQHCDVCAARQP